MEKTSPAPARVVALKLTALTLPVSLRIPFIRRCTIARATGEVEGLMLDLSLSGAYIKSDRPLVDRETVAIAFRVPGNARLIRLPALVAWVNSIQKHPVHSLPPGSGVRFLEVSESDLRLMSDAIRNYCLKNPLYRQYL